MTMLLGGKMYSESVYAVQKGDGVVNPPRAMQSVRWEWYYGTRTDEFAAHVLQLAFLMGYRINEELVDIYRLYNNGRSEAGRGASNLRHIHLAAESDARFSASRMPRTRNIVITTHRHAGQKREQSQR
ncbi:hypothetical protein C8J57DRAFT_1240133 [Mycena rebaudengoi]|nr:hypothetical protein C8J57DRAFT_1240133 [Mycena rebaudengoi]